MAAGRLGVWLRRAFPWLLLLVGVALWVKHLRGADWAAMRRVIAGLPASALLAAVGFTIASYVVYASFDLLGRAVTGHHIGTRRVLAIGLVSHACSLNLGPAGAGFRLRLYLRHGVGAAVAAGVWLLNIATNWLGLVLLAGAALLTGLMQWPAGWRLPGGSAEGLGGVLLALAAAYLVACARANGRSWVVRGRRLSLPPWPVAVAQCVLSVLNWSLLAWVVTVLLPRQVGWGAVLGALTMSAVALSIIDVPGGLGVLETVFVAMLGPQVGAAELLAALLAYRAIYFLAPLILALAAYVVLELDAGAYRDRRAASSERPGGFSSRWRRARCLAWPPTGLALRPRRSSSESTRSPP
jgi:uncharacterized membrane protein YbhN (UPF0104 family)